MKQVPKLDYLLGLQVTGSELTKRVYLQSHFYYIYMQARRERWNGTGPPAHPPYPGGIFFPGKIGKHKVFTCE